MRVLMPLPSSDYDPTESGVSWQVLREAGHEVEFATPDGRPAAVDERVVSGRGFGPWRPFLRARADAREAHRAMADDAAFARPLAYDAIDAARYDGLLLPGGHAPGMKTYLESSLLQSLVATFFADRRPVGAICHGVVLVARSVDPSTGRSVLFGRRTTALTRFMEMSAWRMTGLWLGRYYRTYDRTVEGEVTACLERPEDFLAGPMALLRDRPGALGRGFAVVDGHYVSARWPGDAYRFATEFSNLLESTE